MKIKSKGRKNYPLEAKEVAEIAGVSVGYVKKIRTHKTSGISINSDKARTIKAIDVAAEQNKSSLIQELKRLITL